MRMELIELAKREERQAWVERVDARRRTLPTTIGREEILSAIHDGRVR